MKENNIGATNCSGRVSQAFKSQPTQVRLLSLKIREVYLLFYRGVYTVEVGPTVWWYSVNIGMFQYSWDQINKSQISCLNKFLRLEKYSVLTIISVLMFTKITQWSGGRWQRLFNFAPVSQLSEVCSAISNVQIIFLGHFIDMIWKNQKGVGVGCVEAGSPGSVSLGILPLKGGTDKRLC